jgi:hypothetical protein
MTPFYYVREIEKLLVAIYDMFDNLRVNKYTDMLRTEYANTVRVRLITHYSDDFANWLSSTMSKQQLQVLPVAGLRFVSTSKDDSNLVQPTYAREIYSRRNDFWIRDIQPKPTVFRFELTVLSSNFSDFAQLKENIEPYFNDYRTVRIKEFDFAPEIERPIPIFLAGVADEISDETDNTSSKFQTYKTTYTLEAHGVMHRPYALPAEIRYAEMNFIVNKQYNDVEQILVYPDEIAKQKRRAWETVEPSIREGYSLLKSFAKTLVRRGEVNGEEYWADETLRYAMLTYNEITGYDTHGMTSSGMNPVLKGYQTDENGEYILDEDGDRIPIYDWEEVIVDDIERPAEVPSFDLIHLTFDEDSARAEDMSGLGRDFIAVNDDTRKFIPGLPPGNGTNTDGGYEFDENARAKDWSQILNWFGDNKEGTIESPYTFKATLQFQESVPGDTLFQYLYNPEDVTLEDGTVIPADTVWFDWGVMDSKLYFTYHTSSQYRTFETETFEFDNQMIYSFYFVLYDHGKQGIFGVKTNLNDTMVALKTTEVTDL